MTNERRKTNANTGLTSLRAALYESDFALLKLSESDAG